MRYSIPVIFAELEPEHLEVISLRSALLARTAGAEDPGDPSKASSHLDELRAEGIDWSPQMPEPMIPRRL
ncbi:MAG: hypothetical protein V3S30_05100 [Thermoanaerobaculia bacterium]